MFEILCISGLQWCKIEHYSINVQCKIYNEHQIRHKHKNTRHGIVLFGVNHIFLRLCFVHVKNIAFNTGQGNTLKDWRPIVCYDSSSSAISCNASSSILFSSFIATLTFAQSLRTELPLPGYIMLLMTLPGCPRPRKKFIHNRKCKFYSLVNNITA